MAECIDADVAKRLGIRHSTDAERIENNNKNVVTGGYFATPFLVYVFKVCFSAKKLCT